MTLWIWAVLWAAAVIAAGALMFFAWTGPFRVVSNLSRWAIRLHIRRIPPWLSARAADRWAFRGSLVTIVLLLAVAWFVPWQQVSNEPAVAPQENDNADTGKSTVAPAPTPD